MTGAFHLAAAGMVALMASIPALHAEEGVVRLHAAGSLRPALTELGQAFSKAHGTKVEAQFGSSGLLRERLKRGEGSDVCASADIGNPLALARAGKAGPVVLFARNRLCAVARPGLDVTPGTVLAAMLAPGTKLGTSTPRNDPAGDYAWQVFARADAVQPGARQALEAKALRLTGAPDSPRPRMAAASMPGTSWKAGPTCSWPTAPRGGRRQWRRPASVSWCCRRNWPSAPTMV